MKQDTTLELPVSEQIVAIPQTEMSGLRYLLYQMDQRSLDHEVPTYYVAVKRAIDMAISFIFIITVMSWLTPLIALLIKLTSKGPVFFIQKRTGYKGVEFNCFKFRTMYLNDEADTKQVSINDDRITMIGKFLRITHIDETPQFFNVLIGDMSVVGPRPHMLFHTRNYSESIPYYNIRHEVLPGMTGMAQIKDYIGEISVERELRKRIQWDVYYVKHRSIWLDLNILFGTAGKVFMKIFPFLKKKDK